MGMRVMLDRDGEGRVGLHGTSVPSGVSRVNECRLTFDAGVHMLGTQRGEAVFHCLARRRQSRISRPRTEKPTAGATASMGGARHASERMNDPHHYRF